MKCRERYLKWKLICTLPRIALNRGIQAVAIYESVVQNYPHYKKIPECYFMEAYTYENILGNIGKANEIYKVFLANYPDHELADDARTAIKFLGKSPEEIISEFDKMNSDSLKRVSN